MSLRERTENEAMPLIDGDTVTFVWLGIEQVTLIGDFNDWGMGKPPIPLEKVEDAVWQAQITLPIDAYIEYGFLLGEKRIHDPLNPNYENDGMGSTNSFFRMPQGHDSPLAELKDVPHGPITLHPIDGGNYLVDRHREIYLYHPPSATPSSLLLVFDGTGYREKAKLATIVDNLISQNRIRPISIAFIDPNVGVGRTVEYACSDSTLGFLVYRVLPLVKAKLRLSDDPVGIMGASMGGLMSLYAALRIPEIFGYAYSQSGAFRGENLFYRSVLHELIELYPRRSLRIALDCGLHESFLAANREMNALLYRFGYEHFYREHSSGHNYPSWRMHLWRGLEYLYGT